ncbi:hypothetical protein WMY93_018688 [Mugilogobius chulae]|uniref:Uncharacterized protein n=1 Tax=Mugilogobius chulae TaxID=88201 RepID=A0AAW0NR40_9GOBI
MHQCHTTVSIKSPCEDSSTDVPELTRTDSIILDKRLLENPEGSPSLFVPDTTDEISEKPQPKKLNQRKGSRKLTGLKKKKRSCKPETSPDKSELTRQNLKDLTRADTSDDVTSNERRPNKRKLRRRPLTALKEKKSSCEYEISPDKSELIRQKLEDLTSSGSEDVYVPDLRADTSDDETSDEPQPKKRNKRKAGTRPLTALKKKKFCHKYEISPDKSELTRQKLKGLTISGSEDVHVPDIKADTSDDETSNERRPLTALKGKKRSREYETSPDKPKKKLCDTKWSECVSSTALRNLHESKWNTPQLLPVADDIRKMHQHIDLKREELLKNLENKPNKKSWSDLSKQTLVKLSSLIVVGKEKCQK